MRDFETIFHSSALVELHAKIAQRLPWDVRKWRSVKPADRMGKILAGGFEVALQTDLKFTLGRQALRVNNGGTDLLACCAGGSQGDVPLPRSMASLAIDAFGKRIQKCHLRVGCVFERFGNFGIGVMTEDALVVHWADLPGKSG